MTTTIDPPVVATPQVDVDILRPTPPHRARRGTLLMRSVAVGTAALAAAIQMIAATAGYDAFFPDSMSLALLAGAAALGAACGFALSRVRRRWVVAIGVGTCVVLGGYLTEVLFPETTIHGLPTGDSMLAVGDALLHGLSRMLTVSAPADATGELLAIPATSAFLGASAAVILLRVKPPVLCLVPGVFVLFGTLLLTSGVPTFAWIPTAVFVLTGLAMLAVQATPIPPSSADVDGEPSLAALIGMPRPVRWVGLVCVFVIAVTGFAVVAAAWVPGADGQSRFDLRTVIDDPLTVHQELNPLVNLRRQVDEGSDPVLKLTTNPDAPALDRIRVAALDTYDGVQWTSTGTFRRAGSTLPAGPAFARTQQVTVDIHLQGALPSSFLPEIGRPVTVSGATFGFDAESGLLISDAPATTTGLTYTMTAAVPANAPGDLESASPDGDSQLIRYTTVPDPDGQVAQQLALLAGQLTATAGTPTAKLMALSAYLQTLPERPDAAPGHSYAALARILPNAPPTIDRAVTQEQTVAAFVLMARTIGLPARVAVGYGLTPSPGGPGRYEASPSTATAWAEVPFTDLGWVPFDITPTTTDHTTPPAVAEHPDDPKTDDSPTKQQEDPTSGSANTAASSTDPDPRNLLWIPAIALTFTVLVMTGIVIAKRRRRRKRLGNNDIRTGILGAWNEVTDRLTDLAAPLPVNLTPVETGRWLTEAFTNEIAEPVLLLAPLIDRAQYSSAPLDVNTVDEARYLEAEFRAMLDSRHTRSARLKAAINPRTLLRRSPCT